MKLIVLSEMPYATIKQHMKVVERGTNSCKGEIIEETITEYEKQAQHQEMTTAIDDMTANQLLATSSIQRDKKEKIMDHLAKNEYKICHKIHSCDSKNIPEKKEESSPGRLTKGISVNCCLDVSILVQKFHALFETPHAALQHTQEILKNLVLAGFSMLLEICNHSTDGFYYRYN